MAIIFPVNMVLVSCTSWLPGNTWLIPLCYHYMGDSTSCIVTANNVTIAFKPIGGKLTILPSCQNPQRTISASKESQQPPESYHRETCDTAAQMNQAYDQQSRTSSPADCFCQPSFWRHVWTRVAWSNIFPPPLLRLFLSCLMKDVTLRTCFSHSPNILTYGRVVLCWKAPTIKNFAILQTQA